MKWTMYHKYASKTVLFQMEHMWAISIEVTQLLLIRIRICHSVMSQWL